MKLNLKNKVFSGALQFTVFIGVIIALILAGLLMLQNTHNYFIEQSKATIENIQLSDSGINYLLNQQVEISDTTSVQELSNQNQTVQVNLSNWGMFEKGTVKTTHRKKIFYKSALMGSQIKSINRPILYLKENYKPLIIVGNTFLKGTVFIPELGIKPGYIAGNGFNGKELVKGNIKNSTTLLPKFKKGYIEKLKNIASQNNFSQQDFLGENDLANFSNSFLKPTKIFFRKENIELNNAKITGNVIVKSDTLIRIHKSSLLSDIIIIAPIVEIEDDVTGNFQVLAGKKITIGKNCKLNYPSALVLIQEDTQKIFNELEIDGNNISIDKNTEIRGTVCYISSVKDNNFKTQLYLSEGSIIKGEVYCQGNFELKGKVIGSVYTDQFIVNTAGSIFINHIFNGQITDDNFPENFCGLLFQDNSKGIAKWIH